MVQQLRGGLRVVGEQFDPSDGQQRSGIGWVGAGQGRVVGWGFRVSALHPKVLCELLDLQQIFSVDCGTGGGQGAQHVRLQREQRFFYFSPSLTEFSFSVSGIAFVHLFFFT